MQFMKMEHITAAASAVAPKRTQRKVIHKAASKGVEKIAAKIGFEDAVKKIPIAGAVAGAAFAVGRVAEGDYLGAAGEVASGVASSFPGIGTAASVAIDVGLGARDLHRASRA